VGDAETKEEALLRPALRGASSASELDHVRLAQAGVNLMQSARVAARALPPARISLRTLVVEAAPGASGASWRFGGCVVHHEQYRAWHPLG